MTVAEGGSHSMLGFLAKGSLAACSLAVLIVGFLALAGRSATTKWEAYEDSLRAKGQPVIFAEIEAKRAKVEAAENSATILESLFEKVGAMDQPKPDPSTLIFGSRVEGREIFDEGVPRFTLEPSRAYLETHRPLINALEAIRDKPKGRFNIQYDPRPIFTLIPHITPVRSLSKLVALDNLMALADGNTRRAADGVELQFRLAGSFHDEPMLISQLVRIAVDAMAIQNLEWVLRFGELDEPTLRRMRENIEQRLAHPGLKWGLLGERAFWVETCNNMAERKLKPADISATAGGIDGNSFLPVWLPTMLIRSNQLDGAKMHSGLIEAADNPRDLIKAAEKLDELIPQLPKTRFLVRTLMPSISRATVLQVRCMAQLECGRTALAIEQYRLRTGRFPTALAELVPTELSAVPMDPFDGQPLRLRVMDDRLIVYTVGENLVDDGGNLVEKKENRWQRPDFGFRLLHPEQRKFLINDKPEPSDE